MEHLSTWLGAGVVAAGVSAALLAGAGVAGADTDSGSDSGGTSSSDSAKSAADKPDSTKPDTKPETKPDTTKPDAKKPDTAAEKPDATADDEAKDDETTEEPTTEDVTDQPAKPATAKKKSATSTAAETETKTTPASASEPTEATAAEPVVTEVSAPAVTEPAVIELEAPAKKTAPTTSLAATTRATVAPAVAPTAPSLVGFVGSVIASVVVNVGSIAVSALQAVEALVAGPPVLPPGSTVTVRDSWITLGNGQRIAANWYYPEGETPPDRLVVLQHGFLALGPMYSYTAADIAERTNSIVVTPSIPSNLFLGDDHWLGGTGMASEIADLFVGDRTALTQSALDAGFATRYGLDAATATLPQKFALMGHSLGGNLVPATAGFLALNGGAADLVGVITLDGVPFPGTMATALQRLADYEAETGHYIPIREIGAPKNLYNSISTINEDLTAARPDHFNGVVLTGGVHMDSMRGGNPLIQFAAYVAAGFPQPQNPPAVEELAVQWLDEWFGGDPFVGDDLVPGSTFDIETPAGTAEATVIGNALVRRSLGGPFAVTAPTDIPSANALLTGLAV